MLPGKSFWFLRHGETDYNAAGLSQGALDIELNANGREQARLAGPELARQGIVSIISSPMRRTVETTAIVNEFLNLPVTLEPDLREVIFGGMEGKPLRPWYPEWVEGRYTPEGAETFVQVTARVKTAMQRVLAMPGPVLVVAHGGVFRALCGILGIAMDGYHTANAAPIFCKQTEAGWKLENA